jgi:hypothetical protein
VPTHSKAKIILMRYLNWNPAKLMLTTAIAIVQQKQNARIWSTATAIGTLSYWRGHFKASY